MGFSWLENEDRRCRICLKNKDNYVYIFHHGKRNLSMKIMKLANIKIAENDGYPRTVCLDCSTELEKCFSFVELIKWADNTLKEGPKTFTPGTICNEDKVEFVNIKQEYEPSNIIDNENFVIGSSISGCDEMDIEYNIDVKKDCENEPLPEGDLTNTIQCGQNEGIPVPENNKIVDYGNIMPLNHVEIVENRVILNSNEVLDDPLAQKDPLLQIKSDPLLDVPSSEVNCNILENPSSFWPAINDKPQDSLGLKMYQQKALDNINCIQLRDERTVSPAPSSTNDIISTSGNQNDIIHHASNCKTEVNGEVDNFCLNPIVSSILKNMSSRLSSILLKNSPASNETIGTVRSNSEKKTILQGNFIHRKTKKCSIKITNKSSKETSSTTISSEAIESEKNIIPEIESFCSTCHIEFGSVELLQEHKEIKPFICRVCTESFENHLNLETHFLTHKVFTCKKCSKVFHSKRDLSIHIGSSSKCYNKIECQVCHKMISTSKGELLKRHMLLKHSNMANIYKCVVCGKSFNQSNRLLNHTSLVHTAFENVECNSCNKIFHTPEKLKHHIKMVHLDICNESSPVQCSVCKKIVRKYSLRGHMDKMHDDIVRLCEKCGKSIKGFSAMKLHMQKEHSKIGTFICNLCNQKFDNELLLLTHKRKVHHKRKISKPVFCEICGKQYTTLSTLKIHRAIHFDEKPFKCEICGAAFKQQVILRQHARVHSNIGKYICDNCGDSFKWKQTFDKHIKNCVPPNTENNISNG